MRMCFKHVGQQAGRLTCQLLLKAVGQVWFHVQDQDCRWDVLTAALQYITTSSPLVLALYHTCTLIIIVFISKPLTSSAQRCRTELFSEGGVQKKEVGQLPAGDVVAIVTQSHCI